MLTWGLVAAIAGVLVIAVVVPRVAGATPYTILTSSMRPALPPGTLVVVRPVRSADVAVGDVLTYQRDSGEATVVTHRVVEVGQDAQGTPRWRTRGDANDVVDPGWVRPVQVRGRLWYDVPHLGRLNLLLTGSQRRTATVAVAAALLGYAGLLLTGAARDRLRRGREVVS